MAVNSLYSRVDLTMILVIFVCVITEYSQGQTTTNPSTTTTIETTTTVPASTVPENTGTNKFKISYPDLDLALDSRSKSCKDPDVQTKYGW